MGAWTLIIVEVMGDDGYDQESGIRGFMATACNFLSQMSRSTALEGITALHSKLASLARVIEECWQHPLDAHI